MASGSRSRTRESRGCLGDTGEGARGFRPESEPQACREQLEDVRECARLGRELVPVSPVQRESNDARGRPRDTVGGTIPV